MLLSVNEILNVIRDSASCSFLHVGVLVGLDDGFYISDQMVEWHPRNIGGWERKLWSQAEQQFDFFWQFNFSGIVDCFFV